MHFLAKTSKLGSPWLRPIILAVLALTPLVAYALFVGFMHRDLPIFDDYILQLELARLKATPALSDKLTILFSQLNEHRLVYTRIWFWLVHAINGRLSYSALIVIGNLPLLGIWALLGWMLYRLGVSVVALLPLSWLLFQFQYHANTLWGMASLQNLTIHLLYPLLFVLLLSKRPAAWILSWGVAVWLCFTSGNGFVALVLGGAALLYQRRWRHALAWAGLTGSLVLAYFWSFERPPDFPVADPSTWLEKIVATLIFLGLHLDAYPLPTTYGFYVLNGLAICVPVFLLTFWSGWQLLVRWRQKQPMNQLDQVRLVMLLMSAFVVISALAAVQNRLNFMGWSGLMESRYRLYSTMLVLTGYVQLVTFAVHQQCKTDRLGWVSLLVSVLAWAGIYYRQIGSAYLFRSQALAHYHNWTQLQTGAMQNFIATIFIPSGAEARALERIKTGVSLASHTYPVHPRIIRTLSEQHDTYLIDNADVPNSQSPNEWNMLIFWAKDHFLIFPVKRALNQDLPSFWFNQRWFGSGFQAQTIKWTLKKEPYQLGFLINRFDSMTVYRTRYVVQP